MMAILCRLKGTLVTLILVMLMTYKSIITCWNNWNKEDKTKPITYSLRFTLYASPKELNHAGQVTHIYSRQ